MTPEALKHLNGGANAAPRPVSPWSMPIPAGSPGQAPTPAAPQAVAPAPIPIQIDPGDVGHVSPAK
jgi:hypothetical protein